MPKEAGTATVSLAGKLDHRAVPYTVPMKAVPQECGSLGRFRPALRLFRGAHGLICPTFPVRAMRRTGPAVPPLRSRQPLLRSGVSARGQGRGPTPSRWAVSILHGWAQGARAALAPLAPASAPASAPGGCIRLR